MDSISQPEATTNQVREDLPDAYSQDDQNNIQRHIQLTLSDLLNEELEKVFLDIASRRFLNDTVDLIVDGNFEIRLRLPGTYFCGSGGCTLNLLSYHGDVFSRFTIVDYPVLVDLKVTNGWSDLILSSGN
jgi:hypothetical protein